LTCHVLIGVWFTAKNVESKQTLSDYSVSTHYNRLIELVNAMKGIQKQNYYPLE